LLQARKEKGQIARMDHPDFTDFKFPPKVENDKQESGADKEPPSL